MKKKRNVIESILVFVMYIENPTEFYANKNYYDIVNSIKYLSKKGDHYTIYGNGENIYYAVNTVELLKKSKKLEIEIMDIKIGSYNERGKGHPKCFIMIKIKILNKKREKPLGWNIGAVYRRIGYWRRRGVYGVRACDAVLINHAHMD